MGGYRILWEDMESSPTNIISISHIPNNNIIKSEIFREETYRVRSTYRARQGISLAARRIKPRHLPYMEGASFVSLTEAVEY